MRGADVKGIQTLVDVARRRIDEAEEKERCEEEEKERRERNERELENERQTGTVSGAYEMAQGTGWKMSLT